MNFDDCKWDIVIESKQNPFSVNMKQIMEYKDLIFLLVKRDIAITYKQTIMGPLWYLIQPVCTTIMCMIVFRHVANLGTDGIPPVLFYFAGSILWAFFSRVLTNEAGVFSANKAIFEKVYFPRMAVPIAIFLNEIIKFLIQFVLFFLIFAGYVIFGYGEFLSAKLLLLPVIIFWIGIQAYGLGLIISSVTTKYRDLALALPFFLSLFMYATPVVYPLSEVSEQYRIFFECNPVTAVIECFRIFCFGAGEISLPNVLYSVACTVLFFFAGVILFNKNEKVFVDVI